MDGMLASRPGRYTPRKQPRYPLERKLGGIQRRLSLTLFLFINTQRNITKTIHGCVQCHICTVNQLGKTGLNKHQNHIYSKACRLQI